MAKVALALGLALAWAAPARPASAQLFSPGRLSLAHAGLEGAAQCTRCHRLRTPGADRDRCLGCHEAVRVRIERGRGLHGRMREKDCASCHKEHLGQEFALIRLEPDTFSHGTTGYELVGAHETAECRDCHAPEYISDSGVREELSEPGALGRTYLGLDRRCVSCHAEDDPHRGQFRERACSDCHGAREWQEADAFDHRSTSYPLEGRHREAECEGCHREEEAQGRPAVVRYTPVEASDCGSCHEDPHRGEVSGRCDRCHVVSGWQRLSSSVVEAGFDHGATDFPLQGAHLRAECRACHSLRRPTGEYLDLSFQGKSHGRAYPVPAHEACTSCHLDFHEGTFRDPECDLCHTEEAWETPDYDRARHSEEVEFELSGAHAVTPCQGCHKKGEEEDRRLVFRFEDQGACAACHREEGPHEGEFESVGCDLCHEPEAFVMDRFDHRLLKRAEWAGACASCHEEDDPHGEQFADRDCGSCHGSEEFEIPAFDHAETRYPLDGAHSGVPCEGCHLPEGGTSGMIRYRPIETTCESCHEGVV